MKPMIIVGLNTFREIVRDRVLYGLLIFAIALVFLSLLLGELTFAEQVRIITDLGLVAAQLGSVMLAAFVGSNLVFKELDRQTILTVLSKPISRTQFILGKFIGLSLILILVNIIISTVLGFVCFRFGQVHWIQFFTAIGGIFFESLFVLVVTIFFGVFCRPLMTTIFSISVWLIGHAVNDLYYFSNKSQSVILRPLGLFLSRFFPNLSYFDFKDAVVHGDAINMEQLSRGLIVWFCWFMVLLISSTWIFRRRDFI